MSSIQKQLYLAVEGAKDDARLEMKFRIIDTLKSMMDERGFLNIRTWDIFTMQEAIDRIHNIPSRNPNLVRSKKR